MQDRALGHYERVPCSFSGSAARQNERKSSPCRRRRKHTMGRYEWIRRRTEEIKGKRLHHTCWIADRLEAHGLTRGQAPNRTDPRTNPCPDEWKAAIDQAIAEWTAMQKGALTYRRSRSAARQVGR